MTYPSHPASSLIKTLFTQLHGLHYHEVESLSKVQTMLYYSHVYVEDLTTIYKTPEYEWEPYIGEEDDIKDKVEVEVDDEEDHLEYCSWCHFYGDLFWHVCTRTWLSLSSCLD
jgi:hypothetical protein